MPPILPHPATSRQSAVNIPLFIDPKTPCIRTFGKIALDMRYFLAFESRNNGGYVTLRAENKVECFPVDAETAEELRRFLSGDPLPTSRKDFVRDVERIVDASVRNCVAELKLESKIAAAAFASVAALVLAGVAVIALSF